MNSRVIITFILFILFSFILATNDDDDLERPKDHYIALPIVNNLESAPIHKRDMKLILSRIGREKRHHIHKIPVHENFQQANGNDAGTNTQSQFNLYPELPSTT